MVGLANSTFQVTSEGHSRVLVQSEENKSVNLLLQQKMCNATTNDCIRTDSRASHTESVVVNQSVNLCIAVQMLATPRPSVQNFPKDKI